jgi:hypothetical protein
MIHYIDQELQGHVLKFSGPLEMADAAYEANAPKGDDSFWPVPQINFPGRQGYTWDAFKSFLRQPWPEAVKMIRKVSDAIRAAELPMPMSVKRRHRWSDSDGEVDLDRALRGEPEMYRQTYRTRVRAPTNVAMLCNMDDASNVNPSGLFFRSACAIAVADILEEHGYAVEMHLWCRGKGVYPDPLPNQFSTCLLKAAGDPVDMDALGDSMSGWFAYHAVMASLAACPVAPKDIGEMLDDPGPWQKHMDITDGIREVKVPIIYSRSWFDVVGSGIEVAIETARKILVKFTKGGGLEDDGP